MTEAKVPYDRLESSGDGAVDGSRIKVSPSNTDFISQAISKLETGISGTTFVTRRDFTGVPNTGDEQYILFGRGALPGTGFRWNENSDKVEFSNDGLLWLDLTSIGGSSTKVEPVVVDSTILANKYYDLDLLPSNQNNVRVFLIGGSSQYPGDDFVLTLDGGSLLKRVSWNALGLESLLVLGDKLLFVYETTAEIAGISSGPITLKMESLTLTGTDISNGYIDLAELPLDYTQVPLFIAGGTVQIYGTDYSIIPDGLGDLRRIDLSTLISNGDVVSGDTLVTLYNIGSGAGGAIRSEHIEVDTSTFTNNLSTLTPPSTLQETLEAVDQMVTGTGSGGEITKVQHFVSDGAGTVGGLDYVDLATTPADPETVRVIVIGGSAQLNALLTPGADFTIISDGSSLKRLSWNGLGMATALTGAGIYFQVVYTINTTNPDLASNVQTVTSGFNNILSNTDTEVQAALDKLDNHTHPSSVITTTGFTGILSGQGNVQAALNVVDSSSLDGNTPLVQTYFEDFFAASAISSGAVNQYQVLGRGLTFFPNYSGTSGGGLSCILSYGPLGTFPTPCLTLYTNVASASTISAICMDSGAAGIYGIRSSFFDFDFEARVNLFQFNAASQFVFGLAHVSFAQNISSPGNAALVFEYRPSVNSNFRMYSEDVNGTVIGAVVLGTAPVATTWYKFRLEYRRSLGTLEGFLNGVSIGTVSIGSLGTPGTDQQLTPFFGVGSSGSFQQEMCVDYVHLKLYLDPR